MSTAKNALYAAVGVGGYAIEKARSLPQRVAALPGEVASRAGALKRLGNGGVSLDPKRVRKLVDDQIKQARKQAASARKRTTKVYKDLTKRGEKVVRRIERSAPARRAAEQTKAARSKVKSATTAVRKAGEADVEAAKTAVETGVEHTG